MKSKYALLFLALPLLATSCAKIFERPIEHNACTAMAPVHQGLVIANDDYVKKFAAEILDWRKVGRSYDLKKAVFEAHQNPHNPLSFTYFTKISEEKDFLIYHIDRTDRSVPVCARVQSNRLDTRPDWYIGQTLSDFQEEVEVKEKSGVLSIYATEGSYVRLTFIHGALHQAWYSNGSVD